MNKKTKNEDKAKIKKEKLHYEKPHIETEEILDAGLGSTCNGSTNGSRKATTTDGCRSDRLKT